MANEKKKILIIDDEDTLCFLVRLNLESTGRFEVISTTDPREGIELAKKEKPALVLLDLMMPYMEGSEVAARIKADPESKDIPILFMTALAEKEQSDSSKTGVSADRYISKPITTDELVKRIDRELASR